MSQKKKKAAKPIHLNGFAAFCHIRDPFLQGLNLIF